MSSTKISDTAGSDTVVVGTSPAAAAGNPKVGSLEASVDLGMAVVGDTLVGVRRRAVRLVDSIVAAGFVQTDSSLVLDCKEVKPSDSATVAFSIVTV